MTFCYTFSFTLPSTTSTWMSYPKLPQAHFFQPWDNQENPHCKLLHGIRMYENAPTHSLDFLIFQRKINHFTEPHFSKEGWSIQLLNKFSPHTSWMKSQDSRGIGIFWLSSIWDFFALGCWMYISASLGISREMSTLRPVRAQCCLCCGARLGASVYASQT